MVTSLISSLSSKSSAKLCSLLRGRSPQAPSFSDLRSGTNRPFCALYLLSAVWLGALRSLSSANSFGYTPLTPSGGASSPRDGVNGVYPNERSEEHTSELQSPCNLVC